MTNLRSRDWQGLYQEALTKTYREDFTLRVQFAEAAILSRMTEIVITSETRLEAQSLGDALRALAVLKRAAVKSKKPRRVVNQPSQFPTQIDGAIPPTVASNPSGIDDRRCACLNSLPNPFNPGKFLSRARPNCSVGHYPRNLAASHARASCSSPNRLTQEKSPMRSCATRTVPKATSAETRAAIGPRSNSLRGFGPSQP